MEKMYYDINNLAQYTELLKTPPPKTGSITWGNG